MITDLVQIRTLAQAREDENWRFRTWLKAHSYPEKRFRRIAEEIEEQIDCKACAACCREPRVEVNDKDISRISRSLRISHEKFIAEYTEIDREDNTRILRQNENGCIFLDGKLCGIYVVRPRDCANFPHLVRSDWSLASRMISVLSRVSYCPIVYNALEAYKDAVGFRSGRRGRF